jgi:hypothetical protein
MLSKGKWKETNVLKPPENTLCSEAFFYTQKKLRHKNVLYWYGAVVADD